jgi:N-acetylneuraminic acid mutarotase
MSKTVVMLLVFVLPLSFCVISFKPAWAEEGSWTTLAPIPTARRGLGVAVVEGKIYAIGGGNDWISPYLGTNEMYDPATDTWTTKASMPTPRTDFAIAVYKNKIYCISGKNDQEDLSGVYTDVNEVYDPATDTWEKKSSIPTPRYGMCTNLVDGKIYIMGGGLHAPYPINTCSTLNEVYDPETDTWTEKTPLPTSVLHAASAVVDERIYVLGGQAGLFMGGWHDHNMVYDVKNDSWSMAAPIPVGCQRAAAGATTGVYASKRIYVLGGFTESSYTPQNIVQVYDPENNVWSSGASMLTPHANFGVAVVNDELYAISGSKEGFKPPSVANEKYTPSGYGTPESLTPSPSPPPSSEPTPTPRPESEPFSTTLVVTASLLSVASVGIGLLVYFKKRKH